ncbi:MAG TPA: hypothetical protein VFH61_05645, partial [Thermoleophilia bacterium]|nr:hypothetical protein [Thermoleophilia bacterium]
MAKTADRVGVAAEEYQRLSFAADRAGISQGQFDSAIIKFGKGIGEARTGTGELVEKLKDMNPALLAALTASRSTEEQVLLAADAIGDMTDATDRLTISATLFGRGGGAAFISLLKDGRQPIKDAGDLLERLGGVLASDVLTGTERVNDAITTMSTVFDRNLTAAVLGSRGELDELAKTLESPETLAAIADTASAVGALARAASRLIVPMGKAANAVARFFDAFPELGRLKTESTLASLRTEIIRTQIEFEKLATAQGESVNAGGANEAIEVLREKLDRLRAEEAMIVGPIASTPDPTAVPVPDPRPPPGPVDTSAADTARQQVEDAIALRIQAERELTLVGVTEADKRRGILEAEEIDALATVKGNLQAEEELREAFKIRRFSLEAEIADASVMAQSRIADATRAAQTELAVLGLPPGLARDFELEALGMERALAGIREEGDRMRRQGIIPEEAIQEYEEAAVRLEEAKLAEKLQAPIVELRKEIARTFGQDLRDALKSGEL